MRYRVRGPLHSDTSHIATELRGFIAHTGPIRLGYLQMHGVAAHTIDVSDNGAAFFEETVLPKIGATGSFVEQRTALRQPKELKLTATLCPTTATTLPNLTEWAGVWSEVVYGSRRATVRLRCLPEDAERLRELESQGWRVLRGPAALLAWLSKAVPFAPQFWPSRAGCAAAPAPTEPSAELPAELPAPAPAPTAALAPAKASSLTAAEVLAPATAPNLLLGVTPTGQGVRVAWRAMIVAVQDGGERQDAVIPAMLFRALTQGMGALVIAERSKVTPRAMAPLAKRLRLIDMADPWESARIPWRSLPPEGLKLLLGGELPTPLPETFADTLRAVGRRNLATPVVEALTHEPAHDLAGTLEAGGGVVLLVEPGASASLLASLLILNLSLARITRPLLICRPASLPMPATLADKAVQIVFGDVPTAALQLRAAPDSWVALFPDGQRLTLQENLAAPVEEQGGADHAALISGLDGRGWTPEEVAAFAAAPAQLDEGTAGLGWEADDEAALGNLTPGNAPAGLGWPEELNEADKGAAGLQHANEAPAVVSDGDLGAMLATDVTPALAEADAAALEGDAALDWPESLEEGDKAALGVLTPGNAPAGLSWLESLEEGDEAPAGLQNADEAPLELAGEELTPLTADEVPAGLQDADEAPLELAGEGLEEEGDEAPARLQNADEAPLELEADELTPLTADEMSAGLQNADDAPLELAGEGLEEEGDGAVELAPVTAAVVIDPSLLWEESDGIGADDADAWAVSLLDEEALADLAPGTTGRHRSLGRRRRRVSFTPAARQVAASVTYGVSDDGSGAGLQDADEAPLELAGEELTPLTADEVPAGLQDADEALLELAGEELAPLTADEVPAGLQDADEAPLELAGEELAPLASEEHDEAPAGLQNADEAPLELAGEELEEEGDDLSGWPADLAGEELAPMTAGESGAGLQDADEALLELEADELPAQVSDKAPAGLQDADEAPAEGITSLVAAWRGGASLTALARELRQQQPTLSLLEATQILKAAINGEGVAALASAQHAPAVPASAQPDRLVELLRSLAAVEPVEPAEQEALRRWQEGDQRGQVVRDLAIAYHLKKPDARAVFDRVIFPRVISELNGSAGLVVSYLREASCEPDVELPTVVVDCGTRLLGSPRRNPNSVRALVPVMRELLVTLDEVGRM